MSSPVGSVRFYADPRGNRLQSWTVTPHEGGHVVWLRGPVEAERQIKALDPKYQTLSTSATAGSTWTHALRSPDPLPSPAMRPLLILLTEIISLPSPPGIDIALALDWYKIPQQGVDSRQWANTAIGGLVNSGKYRYKYDARLQAQAGRALVDHMWHAVERHGTLNQTTVVLDVPGHDSTRVSFGSRLAATVARRRGVPMVKVLTRSSFRPEAKSLQGAARESLVMDEFLVSDQVRGQSALVVDDVFQSGASMAAVGKKARQSGAVTVHGLCGVRTMRR